ncbi:hypothetical protein BJ322DRAFT_132105 [Thelephora terrestris]|uniref:F-box domain-containing protein n=1 Tax=Thelephora terrestris TaxID=56493 RepID=A0A9P6HSA9_9AGAM|nr:hypothetical protein BJ322DRAFT_132105 [Thelephora terrestris]
MSLPSLPFDVLFAVFRDLDVVDVIRIGMTCKVIREAAQERHVWIDQLEKLRRENPIFKLATPPLTSLSTWELKTLVTGRTKLRLRLNDDHDDLGFARKGMTIIPEHCNLLLLPGGKYLIVVQFNDIITLRRIELEDDQVSLPVLTHIDSDSYFWVEPDCSELLTTTSPCPMLVFGSLYEHSFFIYRLDHHNGEMILETTFRMSNGHRPLGADGQGRVIGFMVLDHIRLARAIVIHLDHPDTVMESDVHHYVYHTRHSD